MTADIAVLILSTVAVALVAFSVWLQICNHRTYAHRTALNVFIHNHKNWRDLNAWQHRVTYQQHLRALMLFRNPRKLYPEELRGAF